METSKERAKILFYKMLELNDEATSTEMMVEFARLETAQLQADKEELLSILKGLVSDVGNLIGEYDIEWQQAGYFESAKEVIQKHKL